MLSPLHCPSSLRNTNGGTRMVPTTSFAGTALVSLCARDDTADRHNGAVDAHASSARASSRRSIAAIDVMTSSPRKMLFGGELHSDVTRPLQQSLSVRARAEIDECLCD